MAGLPLDSFLHRVDWKQDSQTAGWGRHWQLLPFEKYHLCVKCHKAKVAVESRRSSSVPGLNECLNIKDTEVYVMHLL